MRNEGRLADDGDQEPSVSELPVLDGIRHQLAGHQARDQTGNQRTSAQRQRMTAMH